MSAFLAAMMAELEGPSSLPSFPLAIAKVNPPGWGMMNRPSRYRRSLNAWVEMMRAGSAAEALGDELAPVLLSEPSPGHGGTLSPVCRALFPEQVQPNPLIAKDLKRQIAGKGEENKKRQQNSTKLYKWPTFA